MKFKTNFFRNYLREAPLPLALERSLECTILSSRKFEHPVLDIGCGEGLFAHILFDEKIDVGIDPDNRELEKAKSYAMYDELIACYGDRIPKADRSFKTILSNSVMEHIPDIEPVVREAHRLLSDNGVFYATIPTDRFDHYSIVYVILSALGLQRSAEKFRQFFNRFWRHYHYYSIDGWKALFERNGFHVLDCQPYAPKAICLFDDAMTPLSLPSLISKKLMNRWFWIPGLRRLYAPVLAALFGAKVIVSQDVVDGGIVFFALQKKSTV